MQKKRVGPVGEQSPKYAKGSLSLQDKYVLIQGENQKLRRKIERLCESLRDWRERALYFQAERDHYREQAQERDCDL